MRLRYCLLAAALALAAFPQASWACKIMLPAIDILRGDATGDGRVDVADPVYIQNWLYQGGPAPPCLCAADANDDGQVDNSDAIYLYAFLFMGGPPPPNPFPYCGDDPSSDNLSCNSPSCP